jgi:hypothetical protein
MGKIFIRRPASSQATGRKLRIVQAFLAVPMLQAYNRAGAADWQPWSSLAFSTIRR